MKKKKIKKIEYLEYLSIGLLIGILLSIMIDINILNGIIIGISLGVLLIKIVEDKKIVLATFILLSLIICCLINTIFKFSMSLSSFVLSVGMLISTIIYLLFFRKEKKCKINNYLAIYLFISIIFGFIVGFICYKLIGACLGIGISMILTIIVYRKNNK